MDRFGRAFDMKIIRMHAKMIPGLEVECLLEMTFFPNHAGKQAWTDCYQRGVFPEQISLQLINFIGICSF
jgi:hypothetical protein